MRAFLALVVLACAGCPRPADVMPIDSGPAATVTSDDGQLVLELPAGAGVDPSTLSARRLSAAELASRPDTLFAYELRPDGTQFAAPVRVRWSGDPAVLRMTRDAGTFIEGPWVFPVLTSGGVAELMGDPRITLQLPEYTVTLEGTLTHFSDVSANTPDRERFAGHFAVGFMGLSSVPIEVPAGTASAPLIGMRFWVSKQVGIDVGPTLGGMGSATVTPVDAASKLGFALHGGVPIALTAGRHYSFDLIPSFDFDAAAVTAVEGKSGRLSAHHELTVGVASREHFGFPLMPRISFDVAVAFSGPNRGCMGFITQPKADALGPAVAIPQTLVHAPAFDTCAELEFLVVPTGTLSSTGLRTESTINPATSFFARNARFVNFGVPQIGMGINFSNFHCGDGPFGKTLCPASTAEVPPGDFVVATSVTDGPIPLADPTNRYVYAFVFDSDGVSANNYRAPVNYPKDFYDDTDRWYEASWVPGTGWTLTAKTARMGNIMMVSTLARIIISENTLVLLVPASELEVRNAPYRITAFRHRGDYGLNPPYDWNGDVEPPVGMPLSVVQ